MNYELFLTNKVKKIKQKIKDNMSKMEKKDTILYWFNF